VQFQNAKLPNYTKIQQNSTAIISKTVQCNFKMLNFPIIQKFSKTALQLSAKQHLHTPASSAKQHCNYL